MKLIKLLILGCMFCMAMCMINSHVTASPEQDSFFTTQQVEHVLNGKKQHLKQVQFALLETTMGLEASDLFGKASKLHEEYVEIKQTTQKELLEANSLLEYEIDNLQQLLAAKQAMNEMANSTILTTEQAIKFYQKVINQVRMKPLKLLYKGSRDGFQSVQFHKMCDNRGATVVIIKANTGAIFGGYTSAAWNATVNQYSYSEGAFLFSLVSNSGEERFTKVKQLAPPFAPSQGRSIYSHSRFGPTFGDGHDIHICSNAHENVGSYCSSHAYGDLGTDYLVGAKKGWLVIDIEVYSL